MKNLILFLMVIFLASCATTKDATTGKRSHAYDTYKHHKQIAKENNKHSSYYEFGVCKK